MSGKPCNAWPVKAKELADIAQSYEKSGTEPKHTTKEWLKLAANNFKPFKKYKSRPRT